MTEHYQVSESDLKRIAAGWAISMEAFRSEVEGVVIRSRLRITQNLDKLHSPDLPPSFEGCNRSCWWAAVEWIRSLIRSGEV